MDSTYVLRQVQVGSVPENWRVVRTNKTIFLASSIGYAAVLALLLVFVVWFSLQSNFVIVPRFSPSTLDDKAYTTWRIIDYVVAGLLGAFLVWQIVRSLSNMNAAGSQVLVLLPEGVVMHKGKVPVAIDYATTRDLQISKRKNSDNAVLIVSDAQWEQKQVLVDSRFGNSQELASQVVQNFKNFQEAAAVRQSV